MRAQLRLQASLTVIGEEPSQGNLGRPEPRACELQDPCQAWRVVCTAGDKAASSRASGGFWGSSRGSGALPSSAGLPVRAGRRFRNI